MKKSLLLYSYSAKNAGDMAITIGALDYLSRKYDQCISISRYSKTQENYELSTDYINKRYSNVINQPNPFHLDRSGSALSVLKDYIIGFIKLIFFGDNLFKETIKEVDTVYFNGGNLLRCNKIADFIRLVALLKPLKTAIRHNKKIIVLPHSTAETNLIGKWLLSSVLNNVEILYAREPLSYERFRANFPSCNVKLSTDLAFAINHHTLNGKKKIIAFTTRTQTLGDIGELNDNTKRQIKSSLIKCINYCIDNGFKVKIIIQTKKDVQFTKLIYYEFADNKDVSLIESYDVIKLIEIYSSCSLLVGMRLHSMILAMSVGTPVIGFFKKEWGLKNPGLLQAYSQKFALVDNNNNDLISILKAHDFNSLSSESIKIVNTKNQLLLELKNYEKI